MATTSVSGSTGTVLPGGLPRRAPVTPTPHRAPRPPAPRLDPWPSPAVPAASPDRASDTEEPDPRLLG
jgi:hypothetical protein